MVLDVHLHSPFIALLVDNILVDQSMLFTKCLDSGKETCLSLLWPKCVVSGASNYNRERQTSLPEIRNMVKDTVPRL